MRRVQKSRKYPNIINRIVNRRRRNIHETHTRTTSVKKVNFRRSGEQQQSEKQTTEIDILSAGRNSPPPPLDGIRIVSNDKKRGGFRETERNNNAGGNVQPKLVTLLGEIGEGKFPPPSRKYLSVIQKRTEDFLSEGGLLERKKTLVVSQGGKKLAPCILDDNARGSFFPRNPPRSKMGEKVKISARLVPFLNATCRG